MDPLERGISVYRASRLEALLQPLSLQLQAERPDHVLAAQQVVSMHVGMKRWMLSTLARRDPRGIVANLQIILPSQWLGQCLQDLQLGPGPDQVDPYRPETLRWALLEAIRSEAAADPWLAPMLAADADGRQALALAERLASLLGQYLVYRTDWLLAWQAGRLDLPEPHVLARLWQRLRARLGQRHRGELQPALLAGLGQVARQRGNLHVFGAAHLPPATLDALRVYARHARVSIYMPDPCVQYWVGLGGSRERWQQLAEQGLAAEPALCELGHPLLARWGRLGHYFAMSLVERSEELVADIRHAEDEQPAPAGDRLNALQESIRQFEPGRAACSSGRDDLSLQIHCCHTPLRELEVLHDALLAALAERPELKPGDIVVMAPNIARYLPYIAAVFGPPNGSDRLLPYHLADVRLRRSHPLLEGFANLLAAAQPRLHLAQLLGVLEVAAVQRALQLDAAQSANLQAWLRRAGAIWGLDGASKQAEGLPPVEQHSFAWALQRLLAGYLLGERGVDPEHSALSDIAALDGLESDALPVLGALYRLLCELAEWSRARGRTQPLSAWSDWLLQRIDALFAVELHDAEAAAALATLKRHVQGFREQAAAAGCDPPLSGQALFGLLAQTLEAESEQQPFLSGALTFCGMVPQRALPFPMICVLGLDEDQFPRRSADRGLDLIRRHPRIGDRDVRLDDRYLFLETLMAARWRLHLSYIGEGVRDGKARNPATPLSELMSFLDQVDGRPATAPDHQRPWLQRHPLQPFDARYFCQRAGQPPLPLAYHAGYRALWQGQRGNEDPAACFLSADLPPALAGSALGGDISVERLLRFWREPALGSLRDGLGMRLDALDAELLAESESLQARAERRLRLAERLFWSALEHPERALPLQPPAALQAAGLLPAGLLGEQAYAAERDIASQLLQQLGAFEAEHGRLQRLPDASIALQRQGFRINGQVEHLYAAGAQPLLLRVSPRLNAMLGFRQGLPWLLEWLLLRAQYAERAPSPLLLCPDGPAPWGAHWPRRDPLELDSGLGWLLARLAESPRQPILLFPNTSWALVTGRPDSRISRARSAWEGHPQGGGEQRQAPGYYAWLLRGQRPFDDPAQLDRLRDWAEQAYQVLTGERMLSGASA